jgi:alpha-amylase/alpha-mannosidase (GH57 family)
MKYICIHGHFYQPPRENAWLEKIELQEEAAPFHDWNERINYECYAPNAAARILGKNDLITNITNNYGHISFNFGPTLLSWMENADPETYQAILDADKKSAERFGGHGSAMAQVYSHLIMPLADRRDKETQVIWGMADFEHRFGRKPEGMWLAETAVDTETLEVLAENDIKFTVLAPRQARAIRTPGGEWEDVNEESLNTRRAYRCRLPSGKEIALFFYDGEGSQGVAFKGLLNNGKHFAENLLSAFRPSNEPQLVHIATDGESYGHHHRFGEMALADCLQYIQSFEDVKLTNYGQYLELFPPVYEARIHENSSWSCVHGVERWRSDCGCNTGKMGWHQKWRGPLRDALDWLRDEVREIVEINARKWWEDPWEVRNAYIRVILDRRQETVDKFLEEYAPEITSDSGRAHLLRMLEMQRHAILMYTSCGWFFDEISGIETVQILQYAMRAIAYAGRVSKRNLLTEFLRKLSLAPSNVLGTGAEVFRQKVIPTEVNLKRVAMHFAATSLFEPTIEDLKLFNYRAESRHFERIIQGNYRVATGCATIESIVTGSRKDFCFAVLYLGQQQIIGSISLKLSDEAFTRMQGAVSLTFRQTRLAQVISLMQQYFGPEKFSFTQLFQEEKHKILQAAVARSLNRAESDFRELYNDNYQLMTEMLNSGLPIPETYKGVVRYVLNRDLFQIFQQEKLNIEELRNLARELTKWKVDLTDKEAFRLTAGERIFEELTALEISENTYGQLNLLIEILSVINQMGIELDIWKSQNAFLTLTRKKTANGNLSDEEKLAFSKLGALLKVKY